MNIQIMNDQELKAHNIINEILRRHDHPMDAKKEDIDLLSTFTSGGPKVFVSIGMKSKSTEQVRVEMAKVHEYIKYKLPCAVLIDSVLDGADKDIAIKGDDAGVWFLGESLKLMSEADIVFFVNDYKDFRGCSVERMVAERYGKLCVDVQVAL